MAKKILIADDDTDLRTIASDLVTDLGYETFTVNDGLEVLEYLEKQKPDLLLLDLSMPRLNGWDVARTIRKNPALSDLPIIAFTAHALKGDAQKALDAGCNAYVSKPLIDDSLAKAIDRLLNH